jgi:hypothetical protein
MFLALHPIARMVHACSPVVLWWHSFVYTRPGAEAYTAGRYVQRRVVVETLTFRLTYRTFRYSIHV